MRHRDPEEERGQLEHHEDAEQAERGPLAEVDELDDLRQQDAGDRQQREGPDEPEPDADRHGEVGSRARGRGARRDIAAIVAAVVVSRIPCPAWPPATRR